MQLQFKMKVTLAEKNHVEVRRVVWEAVVSSWRDFLA